MSWNGLRIEGSFSGSRTTERTPVRCFRGALRYPEIGRIDGTGPTVGSIPDLKGLLNCTALRLVRDGRSANPAKTRRIRFFRETTDILASNDLNFAGCGDPEAGGRGADARPYRGYSIVFSAWIPFFRTNYVIICYYFPGKEVTPDVPKGH